MYMCRYIHIYIYTQQFAVTIVIIELQYFFKNTVLLATKIASKLLKILQYFFYSVEFILMKSITTFLSKIIFIYFFFSVYPSIDPCYNYTVLDEPWRAINNTPATVIKCDQSVTWSGWYRLFLNGLSAQIPDTCVQIYSCGTNIPLWIRDGHPTVEDGVVTRDVCGHWNSYCCLYGSFPIKVKACPGNYYVYELVRPTNCNFAYCAGNYIYMSPFLCFID